MGMEMGELIKTEGLSHVFFDQDGNAVKALNGIDLTIRDGEFVVILGPNGSGKSTLARHFNALLIPTAGECFVAGMSVREPENLWTIRQTVGMVFQNPDNQIVAAIVEEDVAFGLENLGLPPAAIAARIDEALALTGMADYRYHAPHLLSGGQKQRVAIAGVLAMRPRCLVLDEPTQMLDPVGRREVLSTVHRLNREEGIAVIHITHYVDEAMNATRVIVMDAGRIVLEGTPLTVLAQSDRLREVGIEVPLAVELSDRLRKMGLAVPKTVLTDDELAVALCQ